MTATSEDNNISKISDSNKQNVLRPTIEFPYSFSNNYYETSNNENPESNDKAHKEIFDFKSLESSILKNSSEKVYQISNLNI